MKNPVVSPYIKQMQNLDPLNEPLLLITGDFEFLKQHTCQELEKSIHKEKTSIIRLDASKLAQDDLSMVFQQPSLFSEKTHYFIEDFEQNKSFVSFLTQLDKKDEISNPLILVSKQKKISSELEKKLSELQAKKITCVQPKSGEFILFTDYLAKSKSLTLDKGAIFFLLDHLGQDLIKINNELNKFSLIFKKKKKTLTTEDLNQYSSFLKEEQVFQLTKLLLEKKIPQAQNIISNLLQSHEQALSIIGIIAFFCRTALFIKTAKQSGTHNDLSSLRLPSFSINNYNKNIDKHSFDSLHRTLKECARCDVVVKTKGKRDSFVIISKIINQLE